jgi:hypothetical protein
MDSSSASTTNGVYLPNFSLATGDLLRAIEHSGSVELRSTDDAGEYYSMAMAKTRPPGLVVEMAIIVIPLTVPRPGEALDFTLLAAADCILPATSSASGAMHLWTLRSVFCRRPLQTSRYRCGVQVSVTYELHCGVDGACSGGSSSKRSGSGLTRTTDAG